MNTPEPITIKSRFSNKADVAVPALVIAMLACVAVIFLTIWDREEIAHEEPGGARAHEMLNAVLWHKTSAEYEAISRQVYALATQNLMIGLQDRSWSALVSKQEKSSLLPPAVIMDIDETVLDNSGYEEQLIADGREFSIESFTAWCNSQQAPAVPGAVEFITKAQSLGVRVFFVSARSPLQRTCTTQSLNRIGVATNGDENDLMLTSGNTKEPHRTKIARDFRVLLLVGDNLDDFVDGSRIDAERRRQIAGQYQQFWGHSWIILPNAMYGHWEAALFSFDYLMSRQRKLGEKQKKITTQK